MVNNKAAKVARYAIMFAIIFVAMMIDKAISVIPISFSMAACVLLVTLSFCFLQNRWSTGVLSGLFFGVASFLKEFIIPSLSVGQAFPPQYWLLITIPSRVLMSIAAFGAYRLALRLFKNLSNAKKRQVASIVVGTFVGLVVNTLAFISSLELARSLFNALHGSIPATENKGVFVMIYGSLVTNILPEYLISLVCVPFVVLGVRRGLKLGVDGNNFNTEQTANAVSVRTQNLSDGFDNSACDDKATGTYRNNVSDNDLHGQSDFAKGNATENERLQQNNRSEKHK